LDQAAARRVVTRCRQSQPRTAGERENGLHQTLSKAPFTNDQTPIVILNRPATISEADAVPRLISTTSGMLLAIPIRPGDLCPKPCPRGLEQKNYLPTLQEFVGHFDGLVENPPGLPRRSRISEVALRSLRAAMAAPSSSLVVE
jgi:hypothetical protein